MSFDLIQANIRAQVRERRQQMSSRAMRRFVRAPHALLSYPKSGRTWLRYMIGEAVRRAYGLGDDFDSQTLHTLHERDPRLPSIWVRHDGLPHFTWLPEQTKLRYAHKNVLLLVRDPRDVVVSMYFQRTKREHLFDGSLAEFLRMRMGSLDSIIAYYNAWARNRRVPRSLLMVRYELMRADAMPELRRVARFFGLDEVTDAHLEAAVEAGRFEKMRELGKTAQNRRIAAASSDDPESFKARRGKVGGYVDYLEPSDIAWMNRRILERLDPFYGYSVPRE